MMSAHLTPLLVRACWRAGENHGFSIISSPNFSETREAAYGLQISCEALLTCLSLPGPRGIHFSFYFPVVKEMVRSGKKGQVLLSHLQEKE